MKTIQISYPKLASALGIAEVFLKREDQHKYGSHKGRSIPLMIKKYFKEGQTNFTISSSGNAALAAIESIQAHNRNNDKKITLKIFIGQNISPIKLKTLTGIIEDAHIEMNQVENPRQSAFALDKAGQAKNLRQSTDDTALIGYAELADELVKIENLSAIFIPTSSGTTAQGIAEHLLKSKNSAQIHIVQTTTVNPLAREFDPDFNPEEKSSADAIVDIIGRRREKLTSAIKQTHGSGWIVSNEEIRAAQKIVADNCNIDISPNSALSVAGLMKAIQHDWKWTGPVVCLITGR
ncbi:MAG TPA: PLP-dependent lyase/thiolase [Candidatus Magasanikbacteria bacterium]|nr:PLP-dependent lyase/thiolase [Candidatus Magasanikbacteria bacterium]